MADSVQSFNRNRAVFIFAVGLVALVLIFLGGLWFSNERGDQLQKLATTDNLKTDEVKKPEESKPEAKKEEPRPPVEKKDNKAPRATPPEEKKETPKPAPKPKEEAPAPAAPVVPRTGPSTPEQSRSIPATGPTSWLLAIPVLLIVAYVFFEYRRSRQAIQRAAYHENSGILTLDS